MEAEGPVVPTRTLARRRFRELLLTHLAGVIVKRRDRVVRGLHEVERILFDVPPVARRYTVPSR